MTAPGIIFWALFAIGLISSRPLLIYLYFASAAFGMLSIVPPALIGGVTILPQMAAGILLFAWTLRRPGAAKTMIEAATDLRAFGLICLFVLYGICSAFVLPRLFQGAVAIIPMRGDGQTLEALTPTSANITQSFYLLSSLLMTLTLFVLFKDERMRKHVLRGLVVGGLVLVTTGVADLIFTSGPALAAFRNASYTLLADAAALDVRRVIGLMPEASSFGGACAVAFGAIYFLRAGLPKDKPTRLATSVALIGLACMTGLSTSSTAYVGMAITLCLMVLNWLRRLAVGRIPRSEFIADSVTLYAGIAVLIFTFALNPSALNLPVEMIQDVVFNKVNSQSYMQRSMWSETALSSLAPTYGLGVGVGGARAASWPISILSNTGIIGAVLLALFLCIILLRRPSASTVEREMMAGAKFGLLAMLSMLTISGGAPDFGWMGAFYFALITYLKRTELAADTSRAKTWRRLIVINAAQKQPSA